MCITPVMDPKAQYFCSTVPNLPTNAAITGRSLRDKNIVVGVLAVPAGAAQKVAGNQLRS